MIEATFSIPVETEPDPRERIGRLFDRHHQRLYRLALRMSRADHEAQDLVQETFLRVARRPGTIPDTDSGAEAWLVRVLINLSRDRFRRNKVRDDNRDQVASEGIQRDHEAAVVAAETVRIALARLSPKRRAILVMYEIEGIETSEIARTLGISRVTVRWHLSAGRKELAEILSPMGASQ